MVDIRLPNIKGTTEKEQLREMKSYLYQLVGQLQWALNEVNKPETQVVKAIVTPSVPYTVPHAVAELANMDAEARFAELKPLIIKSSEIVEAYYEEINKKLVGEYVAESDFGTYVEQTEQTLSQTSTGIEQAYSNIQEILEGIENINFTLGEVNARIKTGFLDYDESGLPIYGLEVGQSNVVDGVNVFNKYARFTAGRLSFYDQNGAEVAYISDYKLYITHAEVRGTLKLGGYRCDTSSGLAFKWVGRE